MSFIFTCLVTDPHNVAGRMRSAALSRRRHHFSLCCTALSWY